MPKLSEKGRAMKDGGLAWGATNSGKSFSIAHHAVKHYATRPGKHLLTGANLKLLGGEIIPLIEFVCDYYKIPYGKYRPMLGTMQVGKSTLIVVAGSNMGDEKRLKTYHNMRSLWAEEVTEQPEVFFDMAVSRRSPREDFIMWATCNPSYPMNWVKRRLDEGRWPHDEMFLTVDNPSMNEEEREAFEAQFTGIFAKRMIDALWAAPEGLIYPHWNHVPTEDIEGPCYIGVDYGESNITAVTYSQMMEDRHVVTREYYYSGYATGIHRSPDEHARAIIAAAPGPILDGWIDPSAKDLRLALEAAGCPIRKANNDKSGYNITDGMLQRNKLAIMSANCPSLTLEIQSLVYNTNMENPASNSVDHATDALRYLACGIWEGRSSVPQTVSYY